ncbi:MAG: hypothetical protein P4L84_11325 [Isosphaeraceae bacterium]|nr:hypothetical protein [Isosphaeraceae bacterium]
MARISEEFASNYLKPEDLGEEDKVFTIDEAEIVEFKDRETGSVQKKVKVTFRESDKALLLNATNRNTLVTLYGDETDEWEGKRITLYPSEVAFGGKLVPCIRVKSKSPKAKGATPTRAKASATATAPAAGDDDEGEGAPF